MKCASGIKSGGERACAPSECHAPVGVHALNGRAGFTTAHTCICTGVQMTLSVYYVFSPKYNHGRTQRSVSPHLRCVFVGCVSGKTDRSLSELE